MVYKNCPICSGDLLTTQQSWTWQCSGCGFLISNLVGVPHKASERMSEGTRSDALKSLRQENFKTIVNRIKLCLKEKPRNSSSLLEVGCAHGWFLLTAEASGLRCIGIEPSSGPILDDQITKQGIEVRRGYFPEACQPLERFDIMVFNDVFEHLPNITEAIQACQNHLNPGGLLVLNLPNSNGFFYRLARLLSSFGMHKPLERLWQKDLPSPHLTYFNPDQLRQFLKKNNFVPRAEIPLHTLSLKELWPRIRYVSQFSVPASIFIYVSIVLAYPFIALLPHDIHCEIFEYQAK